MQFVTFSARQETPSKIVCIGRNYVEHINELGNELPLDMVVFMKPNSAITDRLQAISGEQLHYEAEICFICHSGCFAGVGFGLDLTKRSLQDTLKKQGLPWERSKAFDGSALFSHFAPVKDLADTYAVQLAINGINVQSSDSSHMIYQPSTILSELKRFITLNDGDIVMTGTPAGVGPIVKHDVFTGSVSIQGKRVVSAEWTAE